MGKRGPAKEIAVVDTSAGLCLMRVPDGGTAPCTRCLLARLKEAGFALNSPLSTHFEKGFHSELVARLDGDDPRCASVVRVNPNTNQASVHTLLPVPNCPSCSNRQLRKRRNPALPVDALRDPLLGIVSCFELEQMGESSESLCFTAVGRIHVAGGDLTDSAYSQSSDGESAQAAQLGEAVERYTAFRPEMSRLVTARARDLAGETPPLPLFNGFDKDQLVMSGYHRLTSNLKLAWIEGRALRDGRPVCVPAASVYLRRLWNREEPRIGALMSHGLAAHCSLEDARERALVEVYERFHLTAAWQRQNFGAALPPAVLPEVVSPVLERLKQAGLRLHLMSLVATPSVPVVLAAVVGDCYPWIRFGSGARYKTSEAAARALLEACGGWQLARRNGGEPHLMRLAPVTGAAAHAAYYAIERRAEKVVKMLKRGTGAMQLASESEAKNSVKDEMLRLAPHGVAVCITTPDCRICGFEVVKIVTPGLPLLHFGRVGVPQVHAKRFGLPHVSTPHPFS